MTAGQVISERYELRGILGRGGMGEVYLAYDRRLATEVALKRVPAELSQQPEVRNALVSEARILAKLSHTYIVRLFDLADTSDGVFLVLEYVCGPSLDKFLLQRKVLSTGELQHVVDHVSQGLTRAHSLGIIHRDLKPANLLVSLSGTDRISYLRDGTLPASLLSSEIKVTDFGLAKVILQSRVEASTVIAGTPAYMSPEQFRGEVPSVETDVYALGYVAYVCLAGKVPIGNANALYFHLNVTPPPIQNVPLHINAAIQRAIRKERAERFPAAADFAEALHRPAVTQTLSTRKEESVEAKSNPLFPGRQSWADKRKFSKAWPSFIVVIVFLTAVFVKIGVDQSNHHAGASGVNSTSASSDANSPDARQASDLSSLPLLNPAPRIDAPPPPIGNAQPTAAENQLPHSVMRPEILSTARVTGSSVFGFGPDGMLYVTGSQTNIGAVKSGQLLWQYRLGGDSTSFTISPDGLIWIFDMHDRLFCFNSAGQGGELLNAAVKSKYLSKLRAAKEMKPVVRCSGSTVPFVDLLLPRGREAWRTDLDFECHRDPVTAHSGKILLQTESRNLYFLSEQGQILWTYQAPCLFGELAALSDDTAIGRCDNGKTLIGVRDGRQKFTINSKFSLSAPVAQDQDSHFYRLTDSDVYDRKSLIKTDSNGRDLWVFPIQSPLDPKVAMSPQGEIYLLDDSPRGAFMQVIGDRP